MYSTEFTNTYEHIKAILGEKTPAFNGRVLIDLSTYQSLDEGKSEILKEHGLIVNVVNSQ